MNTQTITTTEEWLLTYTKGGKPHEQPFDIGAEANEAFNTLNENRNCKNVMLYKIITQTTKTLQTRYATVF
jgi:hypothetical protein